MILLAAGGRVSGAQASCCLSTHHPRRWPRRVSHQPHLCPCPALPNGVTTVERAVSLLGAAVQQALQPIAALPDSSVSTGSELHRSLSDERVSYMGALPGSKAASHGVSQRTGLHSGPAQKASKITCSESGPLPGLRDSIWAIKNLKGKLLPGEGRPSGCELERTSQEGGEE